MSYPNLGCFAECLTCEVCSEGLGLPQTQPDLMPDWDDYDDVFGDDMGDWAPTPESDDSIDWPTLGVPVGDYTLAPSYEDGAFGVTISGEF